MSLYPVSSVADEILKIAKAEGKALTPLQLMKLVYIAHGFSLGMDRGDLFNERIEAWKFGPVIPDLYQMTKHFGRDPIPLDQIDDTARVDSETHDFLKDVFSKYGHMSGYQLSQLTHKAGTPWHQVFRPDEMGIEISDETIKAHYKRLIDERRGGRSAA